MNDSSRQSRLDNQTYIKAKNIYQCIKAGAEFKYDSDSLRLLKVVLSIRNKTGELLEKFLRKEGAIISFEQEQSSEKDCDIYIIGDNSGIDQNKKTLPNCEIIVGSIDNGLTDEILSCDLHNSKILYIPGIIVKSGDSKLSDTINNVLECLHISKEIGIPTYYAAKSIR